jgi:hypothetical protein
VCIEAVVNCHDYIIVTHAPETGGFGHDVWTPFVTASQLEERAFMNRWSVMTSVDVLGARSHEFTRTTSTIRLLNDRRPHGAVHWQHTSASKSNTDHSCSSMRSPNIPSNARYMINKFPWRNKCGFDFRQPPPNTIHTVSLAIDVSLDTLMVSVSPTSSVRANILFVQKHLGDFIS